MALLCLQDDQRRDASPRMQRHAHLLGELVLAALGAAIAIKPCRQGMEPPHGVAPRPGERE